MASTALGGSGRFACGKNFVQLNTFILMSDGIYLLKTRSFGLSI